MHIKCVKMKKETKQNVAINSCQIYRIKCNNKSNSDAELAFVLPSEVLFVDSVGNLSWADVEYLENSFDILENVTKKVSIEVEE